MSEATHIDSHVHVWTPDIAQYPRKPGAADYSPASFTPQQYLEIAAAEGVGRAVLIQMTFYGFDNRYLFDAIRDYPNRFSGVAIVDHTSSEVAQQMEFCAQQGVRGFRLLPQIDPSGWRSTESMQRMWTFAAEKQLAICPLINPEALPHVDAMCADHPATSVVIDHLARIGMDGEIRKTDVDALCRLAEHPRVYVKISAFYALGSKRAPYDDLIPMIRRVVETFGSQRLMWGSDAPFQTLDPHRYRDSLLLIRDGLTFLTREDREWILRGTAESVFFKSSC